MRKNIPLFLTLLGNVKKIGRFFQNFVAFSEYLNFTTEWCISKNAFQTKWQLYSSLEGGWCVLWFFLPICLYFKLNHVRLRDEVRNKDQFLRDMRHITTISSFHFFSRSLAWREMEIKSLYKMNYWLMFPSTTG